MEKSLKLGFFGGSFDPIHHGHLIAAQDAFEQLSLAHLSFIPSAQAPLRSDPVRASNEDRLRMIRIAIGQDPRFDVLETEIERGGISYTLDTARELRKIHPAATLIWIVGEDQVAKLARWRGVEELCKLVEFAYLNRPGHTHPSEPNIPNLRLHRLHSHQVGISSTEIRQRTREKRPLHFLLPQGVIRYIDEHELYQINERTKRTAERPQT